MDHVENISLLREENPLKKKFAENHALRVLRDSNLNVPFAERLSGIITNSKSYGQRTLEVCPAEDNCPSNPGRGANLDMYDNGLKVSGWNFISADDQSVTFETKDPFYSFVRVHYHSKDLERESGGAYALTDKELLDENSVVEMSGLEETSI